MSLTGKNLHSPSTLTRRSTCTCTALACWVGIPDPDCSAGVQAHADHGTKTRSHGQTSVTTPTAAEVLLNCVIVCAEGAGWCCSVVLF